jgi:hypothetical protein
MCGYPPISGEEMPYFIGFSTFLYRMAPALPANDGAVPLANRALRHRII